jgi:hypothetical protein
LQLTNSWVIDRPHEFRHQSNRFDDQMLDETGVLVTVVRGGNFTIFPGSD